MAGRGSAPGERRGGRKKGTPNKATAKRQAEIAASGLTPLEHMLRVMRDPKAAKDRRDDMAKAAAPYVHPKLASVEHSGPGGGPIEHNVTRIERVIVDNPPDRNSAGLPAAPSASSR
jgi:hypothetical protein